MGLFGKKQSDKKSEEEVVVPGDKIADNVKQIANDELLARWRKFQLEQNDENIGGFLEELVERAQLLLVVLANRVVGLKADGTLDANEEDDVRFPLMSTNDGKSVQPIFTDWQAVNQLFENWNLSELKENIDTAQVLPITFVDLASMIENNESIDGIAINPFEDNIALERESVLDLLKQARANHAAGIDDDTEIAISDPADLDEAHWTKIQAILAEHDAIARAWVREAHYPDRDALLLVLDTPNLPINEAKELGQMVASAGLKAVEDTNLDFQVGPYTQDALPIIGDAKPRFVR